MNDKDSKLLEEAYEGIVNEYYGRRRRYHDEEDAPPSSPQTIELEVYDEEIGFDEKVPFVVDFSVEPTEYEGGYLFYQGGIDIENVETEVPVKIGNKVFPKGTDAEDMLEYMDFESIDKLHEYISSKLAGQGVEPPIHRYKASWR